MLHEVETGARGRLSRVVSRSLLIIATLVAASAWQAVVFMRAERWDAAQDVLVAHAQQVLTRLLEQEIAARGARSAEGHAPLPDLALARGLDDLVGDLRGRGEDVAPLGAAIARYQHRPSRESGQELEALVVAIRGSIDAANRAHLRRHAEARRELVAIEIVAVILLVVAIAALVRWAHREISHVASVYGAALARSKESEAVAAAATAGESAARRQAEEALRTEEEFLWTLSHELRTPLTAVLGWARLLRARPPTGEALARGLEAIERGARAEARIVDDLLDASRIASGKIQLAVRTFEIDEVIAAAVELCREPATAKRISLSHVPSSGGARVHGDPDRIQQVAWNLVANAVKFTPHGGHVEVRTERADGRAILRVRDDGVGITPEFLPHVFERFRQADSSMRRAYGGLGLGLAIAKHFVELHGGTIDAESEGAGRGATLTVSLPITDAAAAPALASTSPAPVPLSGLRVLIVDDDPDGLALVGAVLREHGALVHAAASGEDALTTLAREDVDVLVADLGLPDLDGYALLRRARAARHALPAVALTAYATKDDIARARAAGFDRHIAKPWDADLLVAAVADLAEPSRRGRERPPAEVA